MILLTNRKVLPILKESKRRSGTAQILEKMSRSFSRVDASFHNEDNVDQISF